MRAFFGSPRRSSLAGLVRLILNLSACGVGNGGRDAGAMPGRRPPRIPKSVWKGGARCSSSHSAPSFNVHVFSRRSRVDGRRCGEGNNGVANGPDPQSADNPPIGDGDGTGLGNPAMHVAAVLISMPSKAISAHMRLTVDSSVEIAWKRPKRTSAVSMISEARLARASIA